MNIVVVRANVEKVLGFDVLNPETVPADLELDQRLAIAQLAILLALAESLVGLLKKQKSMKMLEG